MQHELKALTQLKEKMRSKGYGLKTQQFYLETLREFICFHGKRDPRYMGMREIELFMNHLSHQKNSLFCVKQQAFQVLMFFYTQVLRIPLQKEYIDASRASDYPAIVNQPQHRLIQQVMIF